MTSSGQARKRGARGRENISAHELYRRMHGLSLSALAAAAGRDLSEVSRVERGERAASATYRRAVSRALGVPEKTLFPKLAEREEVSTHSAA